MAAVAGLLRCTIEQVKGHRKASGDEVTQKDELIRTVVQTRFPERQTRSAVLEAFSKVQAMGREIDQIEKQIALREKQINTIEKKETTEATRTRGLTPAGLEQLKKPYRTDIARCQSMLTQQKAMLTQEIEKLEKNFPGETALLSRLERLEEGQGKHPFSMEEPSKLVPEESGWVVVSNPARELELVKIREKLDLNRKIITVFKNRLTSSLSEVEKLLAPKGGHFV